MVLLVFGVVNPITDRFVIAENIMVFDFNKSSLLQMRMTSHHRFLRVVEDYWHRTSSQTLAERLAPVAHKTVLPGRLDHVVLSDLTMLLVDDTQARLATLRRLGRLLEVADPGLICNSLNWTAYSGHKKYWICDFKISRSAIRCILNISLSNLFRANSSWIGKKAFSLRITTSVGVCSAEVFAAVF